MQYLPTKYLPLYVNEETFLIGEEYTRVLCPCVSKANREYWVGVIWNSARIQIIIQSFVARWTCSSDCVTLRNSFSDWPGYSNTFTYATDGTLYVDLTIEYCIRMITTNILREDDELTLRFFFFRMNFSIYNLETRYSYGTPFSKATIEESVDDPWKKIPRGCWRQPLVPAHASKRGSRSAFYRADFTRLLFTHVTRTWYYSYASHVIFSPSLLVCKG